MNFDELDRAMRVYETTHDHVFLPGLYLIARLDGRGFTTLTKKKHPFETPFDPIFRDYMADVTRHLMGCGFHVLYGYTQSDEISLLFDLNETAFGRKERKYLSILSGEASGVFSRLIGESVCFDCRISELPSLELVIDYFRWRSEDAARNSLNAYCYWTMRKQGKSINEATKYFEKKSVSEKNEYLFQQGINFNEVPLWQKRGIGFYYSAQPVKGKNPVTGEDCITLRRVLTVHESLPMKEEYEIWLKNLLQERSS